MGEMIEFAANGKPARGYLARPDGKGNGKGVIVLQEYWGLVPHIKDLADRFAKQGYAALAPDMFDGQSTKSPDEAGRLFMALNVDRAELQLRGACAALRAQGGATGKLGVIGFCMGGALALYAATTSAAEFGACVDFYGVHPNIKPDFARLRAPILGIFAERDTFISPSVARELQKTVQQAGGSMEMHVYDGADHAFFNDSRPEVYNATHAADAWKKTLAFLDKNL